MGLSSGLDFLPPMRHVLFIEIIVMAIFYTTIDFAVISHRSRELFNIFWLIFIAYELRFDMFVKFATVSFAITSILFIFILIYFNEEFLL